MEILRSEQPAPQTLAPTSQDVQTIPWSGRIRPSKLRHPERPLHTATRARLLQLIDDDPAPLTLIVAPAGFGKTMIAGEWAGLAPQAGWLTLDSGDAVWPSFWGHLRQSLASVSLGYGDLVQATLEGTYRPTPLSLGRLLADELQDARAPVRLVLDDFHLAESTDVRSFLDGLLESPPGQLRLLITSRVEPTLQTRRLRMRGLLKEIQATDLLFTPDEVRAFRIVVDGLVKVGSDADAHDLWQRTRGWPAGLRLATIPTDGSPVPARHTSPQPGRLDGRLASLLLDETLAEWTAVEKRILLCCALPDHFTLQLVATLAGADMDAVTATVGFAQSSALCYPSRQIEGDWLEFHPIFREALLHQVHATFPPTEIAELHQRAARWFENAGLPGAAIDHWLDADEPETAAELVERHLHPVLAREDWPSLARYLDRLPDGLVRTHPQLLMGRAWIAHLRGRYGQKRQIAQLVEEQMRARPRGASGRDALAAELQVLQLDNLASVQLQPEIALAQARQALHGLSEERRYPIGIAWLMVAGALQSLGDRDAAEVTLQRLFEQAPDQLDAGSIRGALGLCLLSLQEGNLAQTEVHARTAIHFADKQQLRVTEGWCRAILADVLYERDELDQSIAYNELIARDHAYCHFYCYLESQFTLAQAYIAAGRSSDAQRSMQRTHEFLFESNAIEQLSFFQAQEAYLSLVLGDVEAALDWAARAQPVIAVSALHAMWNAATIQSLIFCAAGNTRQLHEATSQLAKLRARAHEQHFIRPLVRIDAIDAILQLRQNAPQDACSAILRSLDCGLPRGFIRAYLDLRRLFPAEVEELLTRADLPITLRELADELVVGPSSRQGAFENANPLTILTGREQQVLMALHRRLTYDEIADQFFISPHTVKRHACNIYAKLGVSGRAAALRNAMELGWNPGSSTSG